MNLEQVERIVRAVLYEGYILYPYRPSAVKNRQRWNFGVLTPQAYSVAQRGTEAWTMQTECLVRAGVQTRLNIIVRFLQLVEREVGRLNRPLPEPTQGGEPGSQALTPLDVGEQCLHSWQEAVEREVNVSDVDLNELAARPRRSKFDFPARQESEPLRDGDGRTAGLIVRRQQFIAGAVEISAEPAGVQLFKLRVRVLNLTPLEDAQRKTRDEALMQSLVSTHTVLSVQGGEFVSLFDPPASLRALAATCENTGCWPVLVGADGERDCMLSSPIILYDYPQVAPESGGDLFDSTEIDELLTLRVLTLTDEEKREMWSGDPRARQILERAETFSSEQLSRLHGAVRGLRPAEEAEQ
jgi:hypothetical protein